jgi:hypothetical protein
MVTVKVIDAGRKPTSALMLPGNLTEPFEIQETIGARKQERRLL